MSKLQTLIHNFAFEIQEGLSDEQIGEKSAKLLNEILDVVEKEIDNILECSCNDCFDEKVELKLSINKLRV